MFRYFFHPGERWRIIRDTSESLKGYCERAGGTDCYLSLNAWPKPPVDEKQEPGYYDFAFDFDASSVQDAAKECLSVVTWWRHNFPSSPGKIYFSGSKGFHFVVPYSRLGLDPVTTGGVAVGAAQRHIAELLGLQSLDTSIHVQRRVFRVANTKNSKSGLYKIRVTVEDLSDVDGIRDRASRPLGDPYFDTAEYPADPALTTFMQPFIAEAEAASKKILSVAVPEDVVFTSLPACMRNILGDPGIIPRQARTWNRRVPTRNELTFAVATFMRQHGRASKAEALVTLGEPWQAKIAAISNSSAAEIKMSTETCIDSVYAGDHRFACGFVIARGVRCSSSCPLFQKEAKGGKKENNG